TIHIYPLSLHDALPIYYDGSLNKIRKIESRFTESNLLYRSTRLLYMEFEQIDEKPVLTYYAVTGGQKIFLGDSLQYRINAAVSRSEEHTSELQSRENLV